jgi:penicillin amidase
MTLQTHFFRRKATRRTLFALLILLLLAIVATVIAAINLRHDLRTSLPQLDGTLPVAGLTAPVTVTRDDHGVPSIHASTLDDLLFAQGYITASDRLFQMDALRRHAAGTLAEVLGSSLIDHDRLQRFLQLRATADRAVAVLPPDQLHQLQVYANGVNAFIAAATNPQKHSPSAQDSAQDLPVEFHLLHYQPAPWTPRDSLLIALVMSQDLATRFPAKLDREVLSAHLPASLVPDLYPVGSYRDHPPTQTSTDLTTPTDAIDQIPLDRTQSRNRLPSATPHDLAALTLAVRAELCDGCRFGSNNWVVAGSHTATGAPLLSNDMHLGLTTPDIWYEAALHTTALDVTGFTLPGVPFVIVGRNPYVSWGFTNSGADVQDLFIEHLRGHDRTTEFERPDGTWSPVGHQIETIHVRAGHDITLDILTTTHAIGDKSIPTPIISPLYRSERRPLALAWTIYDASTVTSPLYAVNSATDAASLVAAFAGFANVSQNLVYADAHHIGYHLLGRIPIRGPATQHPRPVQPFVLPDNTPPEDDEDESGSLRSPFVCHPEGICISPPYAAPLIRAAYTMYPKASANTRYPKASATTGYPEASANTRYPKASATTRYPKALALGLIGPAKPWALAPRYALQLSAQQPKDLPTAPTTPYTIGSPISSVPVDALDPSQTWSGYIPYDALPSVLDPTSGLIATANSRITADAYPYFIANDWVDAYRIERINLLLQNRNHLTPADMLAVQTDTHSDLDLLVAQRLAYALDHSSITQHDPRLHQAADLLRSFDGDMNPNSSAAAIVAAARAQLWTLLLGPQLRSDNPHARHKLSAPERADLLDLYLWDEKITALEQILQHTPARWLPRAYANWNDLLATSVQQGLKQSGAPANLATWTYGALHPVEIPHPIFGSDGLISDLLGIRTGTGLQPNGGDGTTIKQTGLHFGPSERFTADLADPEDTHANITTGESGNPISPWYLDQFPLWLGGTTLTLPLSHPTTTHTLTLTPN